MTFALTWLAPVLRAAGCQVIEQPDWKTRGRGEMGIVRGVLCHHTGGALHGNAPSLPTVEHGRSDLPGPLSHLFLARDGTFHVLAAGRCNHAGAGEWHGITTGNSSLIGIEAENTGMPNDPWPTGQTDAYARGVGGILSHIGADDVMAAGHKEYALPKGRKIDPSFDMVTFRQHVAAYMAGDEKPAQAILSADVTRSMLRKGDQGPSVAVLQGKLGIKIDGAFGPATELGVKTFQTAHGLTPDGLVGPKTWAAIG